MVAARSFSVDVSDPRVQQLLGVESPVPQRRTVVQLAGDAPSGVTATMALTAGKQEVVVVLGSDVFMTVDVYAVPGAAPVLHIYCPRCHKHSTIRGEHKRISFEPRELNPQRHVVTATGNPELVAAAQFGRLSVEAFECAWEIGDDKHVRSPVHTGASLCRMKLAIDNNRAVEA
jgi:hypothetical protein